MSGLFGSTVIKGNRLTDFASTGARVGTPLPFGYGEFVVEGNIIWAPLPPKETRRVRRQGKGGVKQETFTYTLSYAFGLASGPIYGVKWIKRNGKIVYTTDPNAPVEDAAFAAKWLEKATIYYGTKTQLPDSTIESYEGTGQVSAFRDLCYVVIEEEDVTQNGGAPASYQACLLGSPPEFYLTSEPYAYDSLDNMISHAAMRDGELKIQLVTYDGVEDYFSSAALMRDSELRVPLITYDNPVDNVLSEAAMRDSELRLILKTYEVSADNVLSTAAMRDSNLDVILITYDNPTDNFIATASMRDGELT